jgi:NitT/TauT family transport system ATP-binding protein
MFLEKTDVVLECRSLHQFFGAQPVLHSIDLDVARGGIVAVVGPSGCGKSTLLSAILGTQRPSAGEIRIHSQPGLGERAPGVVARPARDRGIVYQRYSLFPFLTALENVALGPKLDRTGILFRTFNYFTWRKLRRTHLDEAASLLRRFGLEHALKLYPHQMSGGMRQRVALAQALIMQPEILLLDEPFGALDEVTRRELQRMLLELYQENLVARTHGRPAPHTIILVTHELNEAIYVGDRVVGLSQHWNWRERGFRCCPGSTIVYDAPAPVYAPDQEVDEHDFEQQRLAIRKTVFEANSCAATEPQRVAKPALIRCV